MKLAIFQHDGVEQVGIVKDGMVQPVPGLADMTGIMADFAAHEAALRSLEASSEGWLALDAVKLCSPVKRPGKILAIGLNYADHIAESGRETPQQQMWFLKASSSIAGPNDPIQLPKASPDSVDYEVELVAVIGKGGRHITREEAPEAVFGYCVGNDVSVRDWQGHSPQWSIAKSFDTHSPIGPWITLSDEMPDPHGHTIRCSVNGDVRQNSNTANLVFDVWAQIEYLSLAMTLEPGDLIFTGTPGGIGWARQPRLLLQPGDTCRCEIEGIGHIEAICTPE
ncbi:fumarylacetoacetate hydrolase family protein [Novosphingobium sp.]|uniref:fumarylacetoacetate hydrolase family protein n=1 Tax=Novosphingobium sp. TaxID=1874826 RepID=UPI0038BAD8A8